MGQTSCNSLLKSDRVLLPFLWSLSVLSLFPLFSYHLPSFNTKWFLPLSANISTWSLLPRLLDQRSSPCTPPKWFNFWFILIIYGLNIFPSEKSIPWMKKKKVFVVVDVLLFYILTMFPEGPICWNSFPFTWKSPPTLKKSICQNLSALYESQKYHLKANPLKIWLTSLCVQDSARLQGNGDLSVLWLNLQRDWAIHLILQWLLPAQPNWRLLFLFITKCI